MYDLYSHRDMISKICDLEFSILERYNRFLKMYQISHKFPVYNLTTQLRSCNVKLFDDIDKKLDEWHKEVSHKKPTKDEDTSGEQEEQL